MDLPPKGTTTTDIIFTQSELPTPLARAVDYLRTENEQLRSENSTLLARPNRIQDEVSAFWRFPQLPIEVQEMIWNEALTTPQTHLMDPKNISFSRINLLMHSCHGARRLGLLFQFPYYYLDTNETVDDSSPRYYINLDVDTIWLLRYHFIPGFVGVHCSFCQGAVFPMGGHSELLCTHKTPLRRIAMPTSCWREPARVGFRENRAFVLMQCKVKELFIAVEDVEDVMNADFNFKEPIKRAGPYDSWEEADHEIEGNLREWREKILKYSIGK